MIFFCGQKKYIGAFPFRYLIAQRGNEILRLGVAYNDKTFFHAQISVKKLFMMLKIALASLVEDKIVSAGIIAIVRHYKVCKVAFGYPIIHIISAVRLIRALLIAIEAVIFTLATRVKRYIAEIEDRYFICGMVGGNHF